MIEVKNNEDFIKLVHTLNFRYAKTRTNTNPHEYCWANDPNTLEKVQALNKYIQENGEEEEYFGATYITIFIREHKYWSMDHWSKTRILNRNWDFKNSDGSINKSLTESRKGS